MLRLYLSLTMLAFIFPVSAQAGYTFITIDYLRFACSDFINNARDAESHHPTTGYAVRNEEVFL